MAPHTPHLNRRHALGALAGAATLPWHSRLWAAPGAGDTRLVVVLLRGAYDGLSALVPYSEPFYYESRPRTAIAAPDASDGGPLRALPIDGRWAVAPALQLGMPGLLADRQVAFVPFCGTGFVSRSHFQAQDWMEAGLPADDPSPSLDSGFLNRLVQRLGGQAASFTQRLPVMLSGAVPVPNMPWQRNPTPAREGDFAAQVAAMYAGHALEPLFNSGQALRRAMSQSVAMEMDASARQAISATGFALEAGRIGALMAGDPRLRVAFVDVGGWDTHVGQGAATGALANRLEELGRGLAGFADEMGPAWKSTVVVVISEFGRTFRENGSRGTDHGHGTVFWVLGGGVNGGRIAGEQQALTATTLFQNRDYPVLNDYRSVLGGLFARMYGLNAVALGRVFPGTQGADLRLV